MNQVTSSAYLEMLTPWTQDIQSFYRKLACELTYQEEDRALPAHQRLERIQQLRDWYMPNSQVLLLVTRILQAMQFSYCNREPPWATHKAVSHAIHPEVLWQSHEPSTFSEHILLCGITQMGKSRTIERILSQLPARIQHDTPPENNNFCKDQIPYLRIDCPIHPSISAICLDCIRSIHDILHDQPLDTSVRYPEQALMDELELLAQQYAIGVVVMDQAERLTHDTGHPEILNFLDAFSRHTHIAVVLVAAPSLLRLSTHQLQAAALWDTGASLLWLPMEMDQHWHVFMQKMFRYQWIQKSVPIKQDLEEAFYEQVQGIPGFAVRLYQICQSVAILSGKESFSAKDIGAYAKDYMPFVAPILNQFRECRISRPVNYSRIQSYDDLAPLYAHVDTILPQGGGAYTHQLNEQQIIQSVMSTLISDFGVSFAKAHEYLQKARQIHNGSIPEQWLLLHTILNLKYSEETQNVEPISSDSTNPS